MSRPSPTDRREAIRAYKEAPRPAGVYRVRHRASGRTLFGSSPDAPAMLNRITAQLRMRGHPNRRLQQDWIADGPEGFDFEVLDLLPVSEGSHADPAQELALLEELWREKLELAEGDTY